MRTHWVIQGALFVTIITETPLKFTRDMDFTVTKDTHPINYSVGQLPQSRSKSIQFALTLLQDMG